MNRYLILLTSIIWISSCFSEAVDKEERISLSQNFNGLKSIKELDSLKPSNFMDVELIGIEKDTFIREELKNALLLKRRGYQGADNLKIKINNYSGPLEGVVYYGALQKTIDEKPGFPLKNSFQESVVLYQDSNGSYNLSDILKSRKEVEDLIITKYYDLFLHESLEIQKKVYEMIIADEQRYSECCPEYIKQAKYFLNKKKHNLKSIGDLKLEPVYKKIILGLGKDRQFIYINYD